MRPKIYLYLLAVNLFNLRDEVGKISGKCNSKTESHYKRLTRFLCAFSTTELWLHIIDFALNLFFIKKIEYCYLDGTEWKIKRFNLHILMLSLDCQGVAIPLRFEVYNHKGVLSEETRIAFMAKADKITCLANVILVADREFIGDKWFNSFQNLSMSFVCRIRKGMYKNNLLNNRTYESLEKRALKKGKASSLVKIESQTFRLWIIKNDKEDKKEPLIHILTNIIERPNTPNLYRLRWKIDGAARADFIQAFKNKWL